MFASFNNTTVPAKWQENSPTSPGLKSFNKYRSSHLVDYVKAQAQKKQSTRKTNGSNQEMSPGHSENKTTNEDLQHLVATGMQFESNGVQRSRNNKSPAELDLEQLLSDRTTNTKQMI